MTRNTLIATLDNPIFVFTKQVGYLMLRWLGNRSVDMGIEAGRFADRLFEMTIFPANATLDQRYRQLPGVSHAKVKWSLVDYTLLKMMNKMSSIVRDAQNE